MIIQNIPVYFLDGIQPDEDIIKMLEKCAAYRYSRFGTIFKNDGDPSKRSIAFASAAQQEELTTDQPHLQFDLDEHTVYLFPTYGMSVSEITREDIENSAYILWQKPIYVSDSGDGEPWFEE